MTAAVLIVDDDPGMLQSLQDILELEGYQVLLASQPDEALQILSQHRVAVVLSDIRMGEISGLDLLQIVRRHYGDIPVYLMTAYTEPEIIQKAEDLGSPTLGKPLDLAQLLQYLNQAASG